MRLGKRRSKASSYPKSDSCRLPLFCGEEGDELLHFGLLTLDGDHGLHRPWDHFSGPEPLGSWLMLLDSRYNIWDNFPLTTHCMYQSQMQKLRLIISIKWFTSHLGERRELVFTLESSKSVAFDLHTIQSNGTIVHCKVLKCLLEAARPLPNLYFRDLDFYGV